MAASAFTSLTRAQIQCVDLALISEDGKASTAVLQIICLAENFINPFLGNVPIL